MHAQQFEPQNYTKNPIYANIYGKFFQKCWFCSENQQLFSIATIDFVPIDNLPEGLEVGSTTIAVVDVIGVLPDIHRQQGFQALGDGITGSNALGA